MTDEKTPTLSKRLLDGEFDPSPRGDRELAAEIAALERELAKVIEDRDAARQDLADHDEYYIHDR